METYLTSYTDPYTRMVELEAKMDIVINEYMDIYCAIYIYI